MKVVIISISLNTEFNCGLCEHGNEHWWFHCWIIRYEHWRNIDLSWLTTYFLRVEGKMCRETLFIFRASDKVIYCVSDCRFRLGSVVNTAVETRPVGQTPWRCVCGGEGELYLYRLYPRSSFTYRLQFYDKINWIYDTLIFLKIKPLAFVINPL